MPSPADVAEIRSLLDDLHATAAADLTRFWRAVQDRNAAEIIDVLTAAVPHMLTPYTEAAAQIAATWYDDLAPTSAAGAAVYVAVTAPPAPDAAVAASVRWAASPVVPVPPAEGAVPASVAGDAGESVLDRLSGMAERRIFAAARDTVALNADAEPGATWARYASANACAFCRLLATRRDVYTSRRAAERVVGRTGRKRPDGSRGEHGAVRGVRSKDDRYHDHCRCLATPVRPGDSYSPPAYVEEWDQQYRDAVRAARAQMRADGDRGPVSMAAVLAQMRAAEKTSAAAD